VRADLLTHEAMVKFLAALALKFFLHAGQALVGDLLFDTDPIQTAAGLLVLLSLILLAVINELTGKLLHLLAARGVVFDHLLCELLHLVGVGFLFRQLRDGEFVGAFAVNAGRDFLIRALAVLTLLSLLILAELILVELIGLTGLTGLAKLSGLSLPDLSCLRLTGLWLTRLALTRLLLGRLATRLPIGPLSAGSREPRHCCLVQG